MGRRASSREYRNAPRQPSNSPAVLQVRVAEVTAHTHMKIWTGSKQAEEEMMMEGEEVALEQQQQQK